MKEKGVFSTGLETRRYRIKVLELMRSCFLLPCSMAEASHGERLRHTALITTLLKFFPLNTGWGQLNLRMF